MSYSRKGMAALLGWAVALALAAGQARGAGLDLAWDGCGLEGSRNVAPACGAVESHDLVATFQSPVDIDCMFNLVVMIDLLVESAAETPPFWHFESGGCNATGFEVVRDPSGLPGGCTAISPWDTMGAHVVAVVHRGHGRVRLFGQFPRPLSHPVRIEKGVNYFGFRLRFSTRNATAAGGACAGCEERVAIVWNQAWLEADTTLPPDCLAPHTRTTILYGPGLAGQCATWNGASAGACAALPVRAVTWGRIKSLYR